MERNNLINFLGKDVWSVILGFLDLKSVCRLSELSKDWNQFVSQDNSLWETLYNTYRWKEPEPDKEVEKQTIRRFWSLTESPSEAQNNSDNNNNSESNDLFGSAENSKNMTWKEKMRLRKYREKLFTIHYYSYPVRQTFSKNLWFLERATSSRSQCFLCKQMIAQDSLRGWRRMKSKQAPVYSYLVYS